MDDEVGGISRSDFGGYAKLPEAKEDESKTGLVSGKEGDHPQGNEEDIRKWWDIDNNISQRVHAYDPNRLDEMNSIEFCNRKYDENDAGGKKTIWIAFSFRHQEANMKELLGYDVSENEQKWWDTYNHSQHQHMMDPHQMLYGSLELSMKKYDDLNQEERNEVDEIFKKKHSESSAAVKHPKAGEYEEDISNGNIYGIGSGYKCVKCGGSGNLDWAKNHYKYHKESLNMSDVGDIEYNHIITLLDEDKTPHVTYDRDNYMEDIWNEISPEERQHFQDPDDLRYQKAQLEQTGYWDLEPEEQDKFFNYAHTMESNAFDEDNPHPGVDHFGWQNRCTLCGKQLFTPEELEKRKNDLKKSKEATPNIGASGWWNSLSREEKAGIVGDPDIYDLKYSDLSDLQMDQVNYTHFRNKIPEPQKYKPKGSPDGDD